MHNYGFFSFFSLPPCLSPKFWGGHSSWRSIVVVALLLVFSLFFPCFSLRGFYCQRCSAVYFPSSSVISLRVLFTPSPREYDANT